MTSPIPVHIVFILDRSGSMGSVQSDVIGGFNQFLKDQKAQPGDCRMTLVQFDSQDPFEVLQQATKIKEVPTLTSAIYQPRGGTPLLDAEGRAINLMKERELARSAAGKKKEAVLFVTYTDGLENASTEWTFEMLTAAKKEREEAGWTFMYLGAGHDAYGQSAHIGTRSANTQSFVHTSAGHAAASKGASAVATAYRGAAAVGDSATLRSSSQDAYNTFGIKKDAEAVDKDKKKSSLDWTV